VELILGKLAFNLLIIILQKTGVLTKVEAVAVKDGDNFLRVVEHMKTYAQYPGDPPPGESLAPGTTNTNMKL
jgi:hypothetical protein